MAESDADFWRRLWFAAAAYPVGVCLMLRGFVARFGVVPHQVVWPEPLSGGKKMRRKRPKQGQKRIVKKFLLFPLEINGETRWLERATIEEMVEYFVGTFSGQDKGWAWVPHRWVDTNTVA